MTPGIRYRQVSSRSYTAQSTFTTGKNVEDEGLKKQRRNESKSEVMLESDIDVVRALISEIVKLVKVTRSRATSVSDLHCQVLCA